MARQRVTGPPVVIVVRLSHMPGVWQRAGIPQGLNGPFPPSFNPQLPYLELDKLRGLEEAKQYLWQKLRELRRPGPAPYPPPGGGRQDDGPDG